MIFLIRPGVVEYNARMSKISTLFLLWIFIPLCSIFAPLPLGAESPLPSSSTAPQKEIRILTINVWSGLTYKGFFRMGTYPDDPQKRYELLVAEIRKLDPDIIGLHEANPLPAYAKRLAADLDYGGISRVALGGIRFGPVGIPANMREGEAILVKKPWTIEDLGRKRLSGSGIATNWFCFQLGDATQAIAGRVMRDGRQLYAYTAHLRASPFHGPALDQSIERLSHEVSKEKVEKARRSIERDIELRRHELSTLAKYIKQTLPSGMPAVLLGDFNTTAESGELDPLLAGGKWVDTFRLKNPDDEGATWDPPHNPNFRERAGGSTPYDLLRAYHERHPFRIDFVFVNEAIPRDHILESRVVMTPVLGLSPSDHYGVLTVLRW